MKFSALDRQKEIYLKGFAGARPAININLASLEEAARKKLSPQAFAYVAGGAGNESTIESNRAALEKWRIVPRMLRNVGERNTKIELFGQHLPAPFLLSPIGVLELMHPAADIAVAQAAAVLEMPFIFSNQASFSMEKCASQMGNSPRWFQLYWSKSKDLVQSFVQRAENCGCKALEVTLDTTMLGWRVRDLELGYLPFLEGKGIAQYTSDPVFQRMLDESKNGTQEKRTINVHTLSGLIKIVNRYPGGNFFKKLISGKPLKAVQQFINIYSNPCSTWADLKFLREITKLPIVLKGILHPDDARSAVDHGMDGIIVSNHGGRQVDGAIGAADALPMVVEAVNGKIPVLMDSGIRGGADVFKALALGAKAVCIGRPYAYGLAIAGKQGVYDVLRNFMADFELTMGLAGCKQISEITKDKLVKS